MRRTLVTPAAMAASSTSPHPSPLHFHSFSHSCQSQGLCKETPNELHGRGTKTQFQFQFRFQFGFCFSVSNLNFNLQKCIGRNLWLILCVCVCGWHHNKWTSEGKQRCRCGAAAVAATIALDIDMRQISQQLNCAYAASTAPQLNKFQFISIKNDEAASPLPVSCCSGLDSAWVMRRVACLPACLPVLFCSCSGFVLPRGPLGIGNVRPSHNYFCFLQANTLSSCSSVCQTG